MTASTTPTICALLRGESPEWPAPAGDDGIAEFLRDARYHGVTPLLDARFRATEAHGWPTAIRQACHEDALVQSMRELMRRTELVRILAALTTVDIVPLILKGTALAYSHYPSPVLRPRADCDLLVAPAFRDAGARVLRKLGYGRVSGPAGDYVGYQFEMAHTDSHGATFTVDLHWRISNAQAFAWLFDFDELASASVPIDALGQAARRLGDVHALALALLHRVGNNVYVEPGFGDRLIWLYDFRVLVDAMTDDDLARFVRLIGTKGMAAIAIDGLRQCALCLPSPRVDKLIAALESSPAATSGAQHLRAGRLGREWRELLAIPTTAGRLGYLRSRLVPDPDYMRERFPDARAQKLPALHAQRWLEGLGLRSSTRKR